MSDPFSDYNLMNENLDKIARGDLLAVRVSAEHYRWLCSARSTVSAITHTAGGEVEGHPTSVINILQRIRELVRIEQEMKNPNEDPSGQRREPMSPHPLDDENPMEHIARDIRNGIFPKRS